jgi:hypothetical protein
MGFLAILAALGWLWNKLDDVIPKTWQQNALINSPISPF